MRNLIITTLTLSLLFAGISCKRRDRVRVQHTEEEAPQLATTVHMADPRSSSQLLSGFHDIEQNAWRWTTGKFAVLLRAPRGSAEKGALLRLKFSVPEPVIGKLNAVSLKAVIHGTGLAPETFTQPGEFTYERDVSATLLGKDSIKVEFVLDKWLPAGAVDQRELGVIVSSVGFESK
ncbi:MAG TPA: hypothetical protein VN442_23810 [Bryobacteraceae bacterium]|nr:hypothetical protein [Bryobacteraceae bacterium]